MIVHSRYYRALLGLLGALIVWWETFGTGQAQERQVVPTQPAQPPPGGGAQAPTAQLPTTIPGTQPTTIPISVLPIGTSLNLSLVQSSSWNAPQGDENLFAMKLFSRGHYRYTVGPFQFRNLVTAALGANYKQDSIPANSMRVTDNELFAEGVVSWPLGWRIDPYVSGNFRTSLTESFSYSTLGRIRTARFWDPVISQQACGFTLTFAGQPIGLTTRLGFTLQQMRAQHHTRLTDDPLTRTVAETYRAQSGIEWVNEMMGTFDTTFTYTGRLGVFGSFDNLSIWTARSENELRFRVWKFLSVIWTFNVLHDVKISPRTQFRQSLMLGIVQDF